MPSQEEFDELKGRIVELENKLAQSGTAAARTTAADLSAEELAAFAKVRDVIAADWGDRCGINDCYRCVVTRCVTNCIQLCWERCIFECTCGPCNVCGVGGVGGGNIGRFGGLGG